MTVFPRGVNQTIPNTRKKRTWYCTTPFGTYPFLLTPGIQTFALHYKRVAVHAHAMKAYVVSGGTRPRINIGITTQSF